MTISRPCDNLPAIQPGHETLWVSVRAGRQFDESLGARQRGEVARTVGRARAGPGAAPVVALQLSRAGIRPAAPSPSTGAASAIFSAARSRPGPWRRRSAGITYRARHTSVDTGLPGSANTAAPDGATPNHNGLPGRCATLWNTRLHAAASRAPRARGRTGPSTRRRTGSARRACRRWNPRRW